MSKATRFLLLTTAIITALDATNPTPAGAVWEPQHTDDLAEANALVNIGIAEETNREANTVTAKASREGSPKLSGVIDAKHQADGTWKNRKGDRVNEDGSEYVADAKHDARVAFLARSADDVIADIGKLTDDQLAVLPVLRELEVAGKGRSTVLKAIDAAAE